MPATYRHVRTWEEIQRQNKRTGLSDILRQRAQQSTPGHIYTIGDVEVDSDTWDKYSQGDYDLGDGVPRNLRAVKLWATSKEMAALDPTGAAEAKRIIARITAEITGKGEKNMSKPTTARGYLDALKEVYNESRAVYDALQKKLDTAQANCDKAQEDSRKASGTEKTLAEARLNVARGELQIAKEEHQAAYRDMAANHNQRVNALREEFAAFLNDHYSANPDKLDNAAMQLLTSGICTPAELSHLAQRYGDNPTMLRIIGSYAAKMKDSKRNSPEDTRTIYTVEGMARAAKDGSREMKIFDDAAASLMYGLGENAQVSQKMHESICEGRWADFQNNMDNVPNAPVDTSAGE